MWLDQLDIAPGVRWSRAIEDALHNFLRMLVILSPASVDSRNVEDEVSFALDEGKTIIPLPYRDCRIWLVGGPRYLSHRRWRNHWTQQSDGEIRCLTFSTPELGWAVGSGCLILHSSNGGRDWRIVKTGFGIFNSAAFPTSRFGCIVGSRGLIVHSLDAGDTWEKQPTDTPWDLSSVCFPTPHLGWAVGQQGTILRWEAPS